MELEANKELIFGEIYSLEEIACITTQLIIEYGARCTKFIITADKIQLFLFETI